mgnify:CR=1 FL=1
MEILNLLIAAGAMYVFVFLKAFQQRNVAFDHFKWVIPTSWAMAIAEVYVISLIAVQGYSLWLAGAIGTGAGLGAICAMYLHKRIMK